MALHVDLDIKIGDTYWSPRWAVVISGAAVDLSDGDWVVRSQIRLQPGHSQVLHEFTGDGVRLTAPVAGDPVVPSTVQLHVPAAVAETLTPFTGFWDLEIEHPTFGQGGTLFRKTVLEGYARTSWDVTRA